MKKLIVTLTIIATLCSANLSHAADRYVTLYKDADGTTPLTQVIAVDEVAFVLSWWTNNGSDQLSVTKGSANFNIYHYVPKSGAGSNPFTIVGPCTITYTPQNTAHCLLTIKISPNPNIMGVKQ